MKNKVLLIDDDKELCNLIKECIEEEEIAVDYVCSGDLAFQKVKKLQDEYSLHQFTTFINDSPFVGQDISGLL
ncbi:hypothetical protein [Petralouisia muris]|uniref:hypothetical protein n=1 Tax=Petralouisia muris TaxID=3032872 RepID=UPI0014412FA7|nr:hypothetical protein [Petralouisia muris]